MKACGIGSEDRNCSEIRVIKGGVKGRKNTKVLRAIISKQNPAVGAGLKQSFCFNFLGIFQNIREHQRCTDGGIAFYNVFRSVNIQFSPGDFLVRNCS